MITRKERGATVTAETTTRCLVICFTDFRRFVQENGDVAWKLLEHLASSSRRAGARPACNRRNAESNDGEGGIRTLDGGVHPHNALAGRRLQPLGHFSGDP